MNNASKIEQSGIRVPMFVAMAVAVLSVAFVFLSSTPVSTHASGALKDASLVVKEISPQGWGFFTKDPRTPFMTAYVMNEQGVWVQVTRGPNALPKNGFGLNRESRLDEYDHAQIMKGKDLEETWTDCTGGSVSECASGAVETAGQQEWEVSGYDLRLCGTVLLVRQEPVPLDYAGLDYDPSIQAIQAQVTCTVKEGS